MKKIISLFLFLILISFNQLNAQEAESKDTIITEAAPEYPGGDEARIKFLIENIVYPQIAKEANIYGIVYISFIVEKDGSISNVKVLRGIGGGCDEEAIRVVKMMPKWKAGIQNGVPKRAQMYMPISFILKSGRELRKERKEKRKQYIEQTKVISL